MIANDLIRFASAILDESKRVSCLAAAEEFKRLVERRNDLVHANPATISSDQRLVRKGMPWQPNDIDDLADDFTACSSKLNELFHNIL